MGASVKCHGQGQGMAKQKYLDMNWVPWRQDSLRWETLRRRFALLRSICECARGQCGECSAVRPRVQVTCIVDAACALCWLCATIGAPSWHSVCCAVGWLVGQSSAWVGVDRQRFTFATAASLALQRIAHSLLLLLVEVVVHASDEANQPSCCERLTNTVCKLVGHG